MEGVGALAIVWARRPAYAVSVLVLCLIPSITAPQEPPPPYTDLLAAYKRGDAKAALSGLKRLTSSADGAKNVDQWLDGARRARDIASLELALMMHTEGAVDGFAEGATLGLRSWLGQLPAVRHLVNAVRSLAPRSPFMRNWHLLWEAMLQGTGLSIIPASADYLPLALQDFPHDWEVLLAAGSRHEARWWNGSSNPRRLPSGGGESNNGLRTAEDMLNRSLKANPASVESRLRLGRVVFLLDDLDGAEPELRRSAAPAVEPGLRYLGLLFLGELLERRGDDAAALATYESAIGLVTVDQSARVAAAQLAHKEGRRREAAEEIGSTLARPPAGFDPWWLYLRGQWWRFEDRLLAGREMVRR